MKHIVMIALAATATSFAYGAPESMTLADGLSWVAMGAIIGLLISLSSR